MEKKLLFLISLASVLLLPKVVLAQGVTITGMVANVATIVWKVGVIIIVILWVATGILFLAAQGSPEKIGTAKKALFTSIAGTAIIILAYSAAAIIESALLRGV
jgi:hypothetical protein